MPRDETARAGGRLPLAVVAATADPARHAARLAATMYAAWSPCAYEQWPLPFDERLAIPDDLAYRQLRFDARWLGPTPLPRGIRLEAGCLSVDLPDGTSVGDLAVVLRSGLADLSYERVARRPGETRRRYFTNRPVVVAPRYALVTPGDIERVAPVDDLLRFRPTDLPTVAGVLGFSLDSLAIAATVGRSGRAMRRGARGMREFEGDPGTIGGFAEEELVAWATVGAAAGRFDGALHAATRALFLSTAVGSTFGPEVERGMMATAVAAALSLASEDAEGPARFEAKRLVLREYAAEDRSDLVAVMIRAALAHDERRLGLASIRLQARPTRAPRVRAVSAPRTSAGGPTATHLPSRVARAPRRER